MYSVIWVWLLGRADEGGDTAQTGNERRAVTQRCRGTCPGASDSWSDLTEGESEIENNSHLQNDLYINTHFKHWIHIFQVKIMFLYNFYPPEAFNWCAKIEKCLNFATETTFRTETVNIHCALEVTVHSISSHPPLLCQLVLGPRLRLRAACLFDLSPLISCSVLYSALYIFIYLLRLSRWPSLRLYMHLRQHPLRTFHTTD